MKRFLKLLLLSPALMPGFLYAACELKADTSGTLVVGPFYDSTDGVTAETGLTIEDGDILWQQPGSTTIAEEAGFSDCTHRAGGYYTCPYDNTVVDTEGTASYVVNESGAVPVFEKCLVLGADFYDLKYGTTTPVTSRDTGLQFKGTVSGTPGSQTVIPLNGGASNNDAYNGYVACIRNASDAEDCKDIEDYVASGNTITLSGAMDFTVADTNDVWIYAPGFASVSGVQDVNLIQMNGATTPVNNLEDILDGTGGKTLSANLDGSVGSVTGGIDTALGTITTLDGLDTAQDSQHSTTQGYIDTEVAAIKAKTDDITFTNTNEVDVNVKSMNDATLNGDGSDGDKWRD